MGRKSRQISKEGKQLWKSQLCCGLVPGQGQMLSHTKNTHSWGNSETTNDLEVKDRVWKDYQNDESGSQSK